MPGKVKAALLGAVVGAVVVLIIELIAVFLNDEAFFATERSWLILLVGVVAFAWFKYAPMTRKRASTRIKTSESRRRRGQGIHRRCSGRPRVRRS